MGQGRERSSTARPPPRPRWPRWSTCWPICPRWRSRSRPPMRSHRWPSARTAGCVAAAVGRQVVLYDAGTGKPAATLGDHPGPVTSVRFTPDGGSLVAAGGRPGLFGSVAVWDVAKRQKRLDVAGHSDAILAAEVAPGHKMLATAGYDKQVLIWDLVSGKVVRRLKDHSDAVYGLAFSPDGKTLASCAGRPHGQALGLGHRPSHGHALGVDRRALCGGVHPRRVPRAGGRRGSVDPDVAGRRPRRSLRGSNARPSPTTHRSSGWPSPPMGSGWPPAPRIGRSGSGSSIR